MNKTILIESQLIPAAKPRMMIPTANIAIISITVKPETGSSASTIPVSGNVTALAW